MTVPEKCQYGNDRIGNTGGFPGKDALAGVVFQRELEKKAFAMGNGKIPQQLYGDFVKKRISSEYGGFASCTRGKTAFAPLHELLPQELTETFIRGMEQFPRYIEDYNRYDAILSGIESRTSSPVRIWRNEESRARSKGYIPAERVRDMQAGSCRQLWMGSRSLR